MYGPFNSPGGAPSDCRSACGVMERWRRGRETGTWDFGGMS